MGQFLTVLKTSDQGMVVSLWFDRGLNHLEAVLNFLLLLLDVAQDLPVVLVIVGKLWLYLLKVLEDLDILFTRLLVADQVVRVF
jgi:hypothetical protein